jgi:hypothetical protein
MVLQRERGRRRRSRTLQRGEGWCYSGVTVVSQWCYSGVTVVSQWCCRGSEENEGVVEHCEVTVVVLQSVRE